LDNLADLFDRIPNPMMRPCRNPRLLWDMSKYASALRIFSSCCDFRLSHFIDRVTKSASFKLDTFHFHTLSSTRSAGISCRPCYKIRRIKEHLSQGENGDLPVRGSSWNVEGHDLSQAIDLVFLNILAYGKAVDEGRSQHRSRNEQKEFME
jgi:hypothetical protein